MKMLTLSSKFLSCLLLLCLSFFPHRTVATPADPGTTLTIDFTLTNINVNYIATAPALQYLTSVLATVGLLDTNGIKILMIDDLNSTTNLYTNPNRRQLFRLETTNENTYVPSTPLDHSSSVVPIHRLSSSSSSPSSLSPSLSSSFFRGRRLAKSTMVRIIAELALPVNIPSDVAATMAIAAESNLQTSFPSKLLAGLTISGNEFDQATIIHYNVTGGTNYNNGLGINFASSYVFTIPFALGLIVPVVPPVAPSPTPEQPLLSPVQILIVACSLGAFAFISLLVGLLLCWRKRELRKVGTLASEDEPIVVQPPPPPKYQFKNPNRLHNGKKGVNQTNIQHNNNVLKESYDDAVANALAQETTNTGSGGSGSSSNHQSSSMEENHGQRIAHKQGYNPRHHHSTGKHHQ